ncbi:Heat shock chaperonin-binding [Artemisia annua]|uniref:Heat shock chaperonin-binding n=1 Tax=Artemisia annua TaxID=35608 RepID=A0A2U1Q9K6_ARTAN|nr:Heat shock chaperonin-binding [Artemisia annua]
MGLQADHTVHLVIDWKDMLEVAQNLFSGTETTPSNSNPLPNTTTGLDRSTRGMPDMSQLMLYQAISLIMQSLLSNPQYMEQIIGQNPQLQSMFDCNPQLRER